jgi:hypothetical protein
MNTSSSKLDVIKAGEEALTCVYGGLPLEGLDILRWRKFTPKVITGNTSVHVKSLPPTSDSAKFHSLRVYYQCQKWMSETVDIDPTDWGWEIVTPNDACVGSMVFNVQSDAVNVVD